MEPTKLDLINLTSFAVLNDIELQGVKKDSVLYPLGITKNISCEGPDIEAQIQVRIEFNKDKFIPNQTYRAINGDEQTDFPAIFEHLK